MPKPTEQLLRTLDITWFKFTEIFPEETFKKGISVSKSNR